MKHLYAFTNEYGFCTVRRNENFHRFLCFSLGALLHKDVTRNMLKLCMVIESCRLCARASTRTHTHTHTEPAVSSCRANVKFGSVCVIHKTRNLTASLRYEFFFFLLEIFTLQHKQGSLSTFCE